MPIAANKHIKILIKDFQHGNERAFKRIYAYYYNRLLSYGMVISGDKRMVEDVIQDVFMWLVENPNKVKAIRSFDEYLFKAVKQNLFKRGMVYTRHERSKSLWALQRPKSDNDHAEGRLIEEESKNYRDHLVKSLLQDLPPHQQEVLYLRYYEGLSFKEIGQVMSLSNQVARNYAYRAVKTLRKNSVASKIFSSS